MNVYLSSWYVAECFCEASLEPCVHLLRRRPIGNGISRISEALPAIESRAARQLSHRCMSRCEPDAQRLMCELSSTRHSMRASTYEKLYPYTTFNSGA